MKTLNNPGNSVACSGCAQEDCCIWHGMKTLEFLIILAIALHGVGLHKTIMLCYAATSRNSIAYSRCTQGANAHTCGMGICENIHKETHSLESDTTLPHHAIWLHRAGARGWSGPSYRGVWLAWLRYRSAPGGYQWEVDLVLHVKVQ